MLCLNESNVKILNPPEVVNQLFNDNLKLVYPIAHKYRDLEREFDDVVQDGRIGLLRAAQLFDVEKGVVFSTYATYWIKAIILREQIKFRYIKWPHKKYILLHNIRRFCSMFHLKHGRDPLDEEIVSELEDLDSENKVTEKDILFVNQNSYFEKKPLVESSEWNEGDDMSCRGVYLIDKLSLGEETIEDRLVKTKVIPLAKAFYKLNVFERFVIQKRYIDANEYTLEEVAELWSKVTGKWFTREWIRQKEKYALNKLKKYLVEDGYADE